MRQFNVHISKQLYSYSLLLFGWLVVQVNFSITRFSTAITCLYLKGVGYNNPFYTFKDIFKSIKICAVMNFESLTHSMASSDLMNEIVQFANTAEQAGLADCTLAVWQIVLSRLADCTLAVKPTDRVASILQDYSKTVDRLEARVRAVTGGMKVVSTEPPDNHLRQASRRPLPHARCQRGESVIYRRSNVERGDPCRS